MVQPVPEGYRTLTPYLVIDGAARAIDWYVDVLGAKERARMPGPGGMIMHAELELGDSVLMLSDAMGTYPAPEKGKMPPSSIMMYVQDVDAVNAKLAGAGARIDRPIENQFYGDRTVTFQDPFGHLWTVGTHVEDVSEEEMMKRMANMPHQ
jgi:PhnB protein